MTSVDFTHLLAQYPLNRVETKFSGITFPVNRSITLEIYDNLPLRGGVLVRSTAFQPIADGWTGGSFPTLQLQAGRQYFIGFKGMLNMFPNVTRDPGATVLGPDYVGNDGSYQPTYRTCDWECQPLLRFSGPADPPSVVSVTPNSGTGSNQLFKFVFSDPNGYSDIVSATILFNSTLDGRNACFLYYDRRANSVFLINDPSTGSTRVDLGTNASAQNSQCRIDGIASSASGSGNALSLVLALTFKPTFAGAKTIYLNAQDADALFTDLQPLGTWLSGGMNQPPVAAAVSPNTGASSTQTFSFVFSDANGFADLVTTEVIFNKILDATFACTIVFDRLANAAFLLSDTGLSKTKLFFGAYGSAENGQCVVDVSSASFNASGNNLAISGVSVTFTQPFKGTQNIYLYTQDGGGLNSGIPFMGTWTVPTFNNVGPLAVSVSPASGTGATQTFRFTFTDPNGYADLVSPQIIINTGLTGVNGCLISFDRRNNSVALQSDAYNGSTVVRLGTLDTAQNSRCVVYGSGTLVIGSGTDLVLNIAVAFKAGFAGPKNVYMVTSDSAGVSSGVQQRGVWTVPSFNNGAPVAMSASPANASGMGGLFSFTFSDPNGFTDLIQPEVLFNQTLDGRNACLIVYDRFSDLLYLVNDSSTGSTSVAPGSSTSADNGQCSLTGTGSSVAGSGNTLTITLALVFKPSFRGTKNIYLYSQDVEGLNTGFPSFGTWTVPSTPNRPPMTVSVSPTNGTGAAQLFRVKFADPDGYGDLALRRNS